MIMLSFKHAFISLLIIIITIFSLDSHSMSLSVFQSSSQELYGQRLFTASHFHQFFFHLPLFRSLYLRHQEAA